MQLTRPTGKHTPACNTFHSKALYRDFQLQSCFKAVVVIKGPSFPLSPTDSPDLLQVTRPKQRASAPPKAPPFPLSLPQLADSAKAASTCPRHRALTRDATSTFLLAFSVIQLLETGPFTEWTVFSTLLAFSVMLPSQLRHTAVRNWYLY